MSLAYARQLERALTIQLVTTLTPEGAAGAVPPEVERDAPSTVAAYDCSHTSRFV